MTARPSLSSPRKMHGIYYTPVTIAEYLVAWAVRDSKDRVLDPSCGEGVFILEVCKRLETLNPSNIQFREQVVGVDNDSKAISSLEEELRRLYGSGAPHLIEADFFTLQMTDQLADDTSIGRFDAVIGNPPFIRYHNFNGSIRERALLRVTQQGVDLSKLASSWAYFVVHASGFLSKRGRLAMVLPAELLQVDYAAPVRNYMCKWFDSIQIVAFDKRIFGGVQTDALLILAERGTGNRAFSVERVTNLVKLGMPNSHPVTHFPFSEIYAQEKWTSLLLDESLRGYAKKAFSATGIKPLGTLGRVDIGVVTGKNSLFIVPRSTVEKEGIEEETLTPILTSSKYLKGIEFTEHDLEILIRKDKPVFLIDADKYHGDFTKTNSYRYLEQKGSDARITYKCRNRNPWYVVPSTAIPDAFVVYMAKDIPRLVANSVKVTSTNNVHRFFRFDPKLNISDLAVSFCSVFTMLSAELAGRSYGGGVFKLETKEAEKLLVPADLTQPFFEENRKQLDTLLRRRKLVEAVKFVDDALTRTGRFDEVVIKGAEEAWSVLRLRRMARMGSK